MRRRGSTAPDAGSRIASSSRPSSRQRGSGLYLSSETLMTPSSLGTITAIFTTSWDPSTRCSKIGFRVRGLGWISAAIGGGGAPGAPLPTAHWGRAEETARGQAGAETRTLVGPSGKPGTRDHSLAAAPGNDSALPASCTETATTGATTPHHHQRRGRRARGRSQYGAGPAAGGGRWSARGRWHFRKGGGGGGGGGT